MISLLSNILGLAFALFFLPRAQAVNFTALELFWSYNHSPPVYPSPPGQGLGDWADAYEKAATAVKAMSNEEKNNITSGYSTDALLLISACAGLTFSAPSIGYPGMCFADAENGVREASLVNAYPAGIHAAASWNKTLVYDRGYYMGREFKAKGVNVINGPVLDPIGRVVTSGRNWEGFGSDPYLAGALVNASIHALQESVIACVKHYLAYEQETNRQPVGHNASYSSNVDDKTMHELYLWPFADAVHAGVGSVMCSYNRVNDSYACQNSKILNGLLKTELGFQGFVASDWDAQLTGIASANAGLDMAMPNSLYWPGNLTLAVENGTMTQERLDDMTTRILAAWYKFAPFENPGFGMQPALVNDLAPVDGRDPASKPTIFQGAVEGHVLVKNVNGALPLNKPKYLSVFGYDAGLPPQVNPARNPSWYIGYESVNYTVALLADYTAGDYFPSTATLGTLITGGGSGASVPAYISSPLAALIDQAVEDNTFVSWDVESYAPTVPVGTDASLVFINEFAAESVDRSTLADADSDALVSSVASQCNNTIVVIHNAGTRLVDAWIENPNVTAVIFGHLPGQDSGKAITEILYGRQSPSGRLPYTVAKNATDYGPLLYATGPINFTEHVDTDYRYFLAHNITPRYEFGYGLTYSEFEYTDLQIEVNSASLPAYAPGNDTAEGGLPSLWENVAQVTVLLSNKGTYTASEVSQLYIGIPGGPAKVLRGFDKLNLKPGQSTEVVFPLTRRDLSEWDVVCQNWKMQSESYSVYVGASVLDIRLTSSMNLQLSTTNAKC